MLTWKRKVMRALKAITEGNGKKQWLETALDEK